MKKLTFGLFDVCAFGVDPAARPRCR